MNSAFRAIRLVAQSRNTCIKCYSPPGGIRRKKWRASPILSENKASVWELALYILKQLFASVSVNSGGYLPRRSGLVNIHRYSPPLRRVIVQYKSVTQLYPLLGGSIWCSWNPTWQSVWVWICFPDPTSVSVFPKNVTLNESDEAHINCNATGNPTPWFSWFKRDNRNDVLSSSDRLIWRVKGKEDEGDYVCSAWNGVGPPASQSAKLTVQSKGKFICQFNTRQR